MDRTHPLAAVCDVEQNPAKAGLVQRPADWPWSSARAHLEGRDDELVRVGPMLDMVGDWAIYLREKIQPTKRCALNDTRVPDARWATQSL